jgi:two-component system invasion response regulator UvrY
VKKSATARALFALCRVVVVGDTCISEEGIAAIVERGKKCRVCGSAHGSYDAGELIRKHQPDVLLVDPFLEDRDAIRWIKDLATEFPRIRILIVTGQSERIYAERTLHAGAAGYWMKNGSADELLRAVETVAAGKIYVSPLVTSLAHAEGNTAEWNQVPSSLSSNSYDRAVGLLPLSDLTDSKSNTAVDVGTLLANTANKDSHWLFKMNQRLLRMDELQTIVRQKGFRVEVLAAHVGMGVRTLQRQFQHQCHTTPKHWVMLERMRSAPPLLAEGLLNKQVAAALGYTCESNFCRDFKRYFGCTPQEFAHSPSPLLMVSRFDKELSHFDKRSTLRP